MSRRINVCHDSQYYVFTIAPCFRYSTATCGVLPCFSAKNDDAHFKEMIPYSCSQQLWGIASNRLNAVQDSMLPQAHLEL